MGGRGFAGATSRRSAKLEKQIGAANAELSQYEAHVAAANAEADRLDAEYAKEYAELGISGYSAMTADERQDLIDNYLLDKAGYSSDQLIRLQGIAEKRDADQAELDRLNHGQFALFNVTTGRR